MSKNKICILTSSFPPERGATPNRMYHLAKLLIANGYEVTVISSMPNYPTGKIFDAYIGRRTCYETFDGINVYRLWGVPTNSSSKLLRLISIISFSASILYYATKYIKKIKPNILITSSPPLHFAYFGLKKSKTVPIKILNISDLWPQSLIDLSYIKNKILIKILTQIEISIYTKADAFTTQSISIKKHIETYNNKPLFLYRNLQPIEQSLPSKKTKDSKYKIVYAGLLGIAQNLLNIIKGIDFNSFNVAFDIYGDGYEKDLIQEYLGMFPGKGISYKGTFNVDQMSEIYSKYHLMLIPLSSEIHGALPSKIFTAMAHGLPIIFCGGGEGEKIINEHKLGFTSLPNDINALKENIKTISNLNIEAYNNIRNNVIKTAHDTYNIENQNKEFIAFILSLTKSL